MTGQTGGSWGSPVGRGSGVPNPVGSRRSASRGRARNPKRTFGVLGEHHIRVVMVLKARLRGSDLGVIGMGFDVLLQILRPLKGLATEVTLVRLQGDMHANMGGDMVALDGGRVAVAPLAGQVQVVGAFAADMALADMFLYDSP